MQEKIDAQELKSETKRQAVSIGRLVLIVFIVILFIIIGAQFILITEYKENVNSLTNELNMSNFEAKCIEEENFIQQSENTIVQPSYDTTVYLPATNKLDNWYYYDEEASRDFAMPSFRIWYPEKWKLSVTKPSAPSKMFVTIINLEDQNGTTMTIAQDTGGYAACRFADDPLYHSREGDMTVYLRDEVIIKRKDGAHWRLGIIEDSENNEGSQGKPAYKVCAPSSKKSGAEFVNFLPIGFIEVNVNSQSGLQQLITILERIEINESNVSQSKNQPGEVDGNLE